MFGGRVPPSAAAFLKTANRYPAHAPLRRRYAAECLRERGCRRCDRRSCTASHLLAACPRRTTACSGNSFIGHSTCRSKLYVACGWQTIHSSAPARRGETRATWPGLSHPPQTRIHRQAPMLLQQRQPLSHQLIFGFGRSFLFKKNCAHRVRRNRFVFLPQKAQRLAVEIFQRPRINTQRASSFCLRQLVKGSQQTCGQLPPWLSPKDHRGGWHGRERGGSSAKVRVPPAQKRAGFHGNQRRQPRSTNPLA